jgi:hypothetical protein
MTENENLSEDLEKMITEAEMEAQIEEGQVDEETSSFEDEPAEVTDDVTPEKKELSKARKIYRRILVWLVVIAITFAGGFFLDTVLRYHPEKTRVEELIIDLKESSDTIMALEAEIEELSQLEDQNAALLVEIEMVNTHLTLLSARTAVANATLALEQDKPDDATLELEKLGKTLINLKSLLSGDEEVIVENLIQRQQLIVIEREKDNLSAQTDLEILAARLNNLEITLFLTP